MWYNTVTWNPGQTIPRDGSDRGRPAAAAADEAAGAVMHGQDALRRGHRDGGEEAAHHDLAQPGDPVGGERLKDGDCQRPPRSAHLLQSTYVIVPSYSVSVYV